MKVAVASWFDPDVKASMRGDRSVFKRVVSISQSKPRWAKPDTRISEFCPGWDLVEGFKKRGLLWEEYRKFFLERLHQDEERFKRAVAKVQDGDVLCCWELEGHCHRFLIAVELEELGIEVEKR